MTDWDALPPSFYDMTRAQRRAYLAQFLLEMPASAERLARVLEQVDADPGLARQTSPDSLGPIWAAILGSVPLTWSADYIPRVPPEWKPVRKATLEAWGDLTQLPSWAPRERLHYLYFSPDTLWIIDMLARHMGQVFLANWPGLGWMAGPANPSSNLDRNQPVIGRRTTWFNPIRPVSILVARQISGEPIVDQPADLRELYERWAVHIANWEP